MGRAGHAMAAGFRLQPVLACSSVLRTTRFLRLQGSTVEEPYRNALTCSFEPSPKGRELPTVRDPDCPIDNRLLG